VVEGVGAAVADAVVEGECTWEVAAAVVADPQWVEWVAVEVRVQARVVLRR
jgi:hypothetical protein